MGKEQQEQDKKINNNLCAVCDGKLRDSVNYYGIESKQCSICGMWFAFLPFSMKWARTGYQHGTVGWLLHELQKKAKNV